MTGEWCGIILANMYMNNEIVHYNRLIVTLTKTKPLRDCSGAGIHITVNVLINIRH